jgi:hypothetical protein
MKFIAFVELLLIGGLLYLLFFNPRERVVTVEVPAPASEATVRIVTNIVVHAEPTAVEIQTAAPAAAGAATGGTTNTFNPGTMNP